MSLRPRPTPTKPLSNSGTATLITLSGPLQSLLQRAISQTLTTTANLANLLPTGTVMVFQLLTPVFSNNGSCDPFHRALTFLLLLLLSLFCFIASFTDSVKASDGQVYYGLATFKGLFLLDCPDISGSGLPDLTKYRIVFIDWVHAVLSVLVFGVVAVKDKNMVACFYPQPGHTTQGVLYIVPAIGVVCSFLFVVFPTRRHGIGYPVTPGK